MNLNRRRSSSSETWGRVFVLLILLFVGLNIVDRTIGLDGIFRRVENSPTAVPSQTATLPIFFATAEEYVFVPPTQILPTATLISTPTRTPVPQLPVELTVIDDGEPVERIAPLTAIGLCEAPDKSSLYVSYDPFTQSYRLLTDPIPYLAEPADLFSLALRDGLLQRSLPPDFFSDFPLPAAWRADMQYAVLAIAADQDAVVVHRWDTEEKIYWLSRGSETFVELLALPNSLEDSYTDANHEWLFLRLLNENNISDLLAINLTTGGVAALTEFQNEGAYGGVLSPNGNDFAYWTSEGIWVIKLDGTFGALSFPASSHPAWSPDGQQLAIVQGETLAIGSIAGLTETGVEVTPLAAQGQQPEWSPDGSTILYWRKEGTACTLNYWNLQKGLSIEVFRTQNRICQSSTLPRWSPDGDRVLLNLPSTGAAGQTSGDLVCQISSAQCGYLRYTEGNYPCRGGEWTSYTLPYSWEFEEALEGWYPIQQLGLLQIENGILSTDSRGMTPVLNSPRNLNINADVYPLIEVTMSITSGIAAEFNFSVASDPILRPERIFSFEITPDGQMHRYVIDLRKFSAWDGIVRYLRFRPTNQPFSGIEIQSIRLLPALDGFD